MRSAGHVAHMGEIRNAYKLWSENLKEDLNVYWRITLKYMSLTQACWGHISKDRDQCWAEYGKELLDFTKFFNFLSS
jgi:hypothetical protein